MLVCRVELTVFVVIPMAPTGPPLNRNVTWNAVEMALKHAGGTWGMVSSKPIEKRTMSSYKVYTKYCCLSKSTQKNLNFHHLSPFSIVFFSFIWKWIKRFPLKFWSIFWKKNQELTEIPRRIVFFSVSQTIHRDGYNLKYTHKTWIDLLLCYFATQEVLRGFSFLSKFIFSISILGCRCIAKTV